MKTCRVLPHVLCILGGAWLAVFSSATHVAAAPGDEHWDTNFGWPGTTNVVYALGHHDDRIYTGGDNLTAGATNSAIDVWDGTNWSTLGAVYGNLSIVYDLEFIGSDIYVGGVFTGVSGVSASGLARWNGTTWSSVGGFRGAVFALATDGVNLFVGGVFTNVGGTIMTNVARWDGASWSGMGAGLGPYYANGSGGVATLLWTGSQLYAGGAFTNSGPTKVSALARWNGSAWTEVGGGVVTGNIEPARVQALAWNGADLFVGGYFNLAGAAFAVNVAKWTGTAWTAPLGNLNNEVYALAIIENTLYIGGAFTNAGGTFAPGIARWNGSPSAFFAPAGILNSDVNELMVIGTNLYAGGFFTQADDKVVNHVALRTPSGWSALGSGHGLSLFGRAVNATSNGVFVGGFFSGAGNSAARRIARWDGTNWWPLGSGLKGTNEGNGTLVNAIKSRGADVFVYGQFTNAGGVTARNIARWNTQASAWSALGGGIEGSVGTLDVTADRVYVGGTFTNAGGVSVNRIAAWDGTAWSDVGGGVNSNVVAIVATESGVYFAGRFTQAGGSVPANRVVRWTGSAWQSLGVGAENGLNGTVTAMAVDGADVYVMGSFTAAGSVPANRVARWNGTQWSALGSGLSGSGSVAYNYMIVNKGFLYVAGSFTNAGGIYAPAVARWDGDSWSGLGSGLSMQPGSPSALGLAAWGDDIYVTGSFIGAGDKDSHYIARWNEQINFDGVVSVVLSALQSLADGTFVFRVNTSGMPGYVIEATTDFSSWTPLLTNSTSPYEFRDLTAPGHRHRFYRARQGQ